ncbi:hypothetical protein [Baaleninema sp.]|uniref:hypothetical protein n=1 Tax=Baaleninema sp. TaxID=3101197 RepID=UPI003D03DFAA
MSKGWIGGDGKLEPIESVENWVSPLLGIRFELTPAQLELYRPDGTPFLTSVELAQRLERLEAKLRELGIDPKNI